MALSDAQQKQLLADVHTLTTQVAALTKTVAAVSKTATDAKNAAEFFAYQGHAQLGVTDGKHTGGDGRTIPPGLPLSFIDYNVQKFGKA